MTAKKYLQKIDSQELEMTTSALFSKSEKNEIHEIFEQLRKLCLKKTEVVFTEL